MAGLTMRNPFSTSPNPRWRTSTLFLILLPVFIILTLSTTTYSAYSSSDPSALYTEEYDLDSESRTFYSHYLSFSPLRYLSKGDKGDSSATGRTGSRPLPQVHLFLPVDAGALRDNGQFCKVAHSAIVNGWTPNVYNLGGREGRKHSAKVFGLYELLHSPNQTQGFKDDDLIFMIDAFDVWLQLSPAVTVRRFLEYGADIVVGTDRACWPNGVDSPECRGAAQSNLPSDLWHGEAGKDGMYLRPNAANSGTIIGRFGAMKKFYAALIEILGDESYVWPGDQGAFNKLLTSGLFRLDYENRLFWASNMDNGGLTFLNTRYPPDVSSSIGWHDAFATPWQNALAFGPGDRYSVNPSKQSEIIPGPPIDPTDPNDPLSDASAAKLEAESDSSSNSHLSSGPSRADLEAAKIARLIDSYADDNTGSMPWEFYPSLAYHKYTGQVPVSIHMNDAGKKHELDSLWTENWWGHPRRKRLWEIAKRRMERGVVRYAEEGGYTEEEIRGVCPSLHIWYS